MDRGKHQKRWDRIISRYGILLVIRITVPSGVLQNMGMILHVVRPFVGPECADAHYFQYLLYS